MSQRSIDCTRGEPGDEAIRYLYQCLLLAHILDNIVYTYDFVVFTYTYDFVVSFLAVSTVSTTLD